MKLRTYPLSQTYNPTCTPHLRMHAYIHTYLQMRSMLRSGWTSTGRVQRTVVTLEMLVLVRTMMVLVVATAAAAATAAVMLALRMAILNHRLPKHAVLVLPRTVATAPAVVVLVKRQAVVVLNSRYRHNPTQPRILCQLLDLPTRANLIVSNFQSHHAFA